MKQEQNEWVYISGKITDTNKQKQRDNLDLFNKKEVELMNIWPNVFNPATMETKEDTPWEVYLARDLAWIAQNKPDLFMLKNWENSKGAKLERQFAKVLGLNIFYEALPDGFDR